MALEIPPLRTDGLQLAEEARFQRRFQRIERVAWGLFAILVVVAAIGLTGGGGPLSRQEIELGQVRLDLPRIARWQSSDHILVSFDSAEPGSTVRLGGSFNSYFSVEAIQPQPLSSRIRGDGFDLEFEAAGAGTARLSLRPTGPGYATIDLEAGGDTASAGIIVLP